MTPTCTVQDDNVFTHVCSQRIILQSYGKFQYNLEHFGMTMVEMFWTVKKQNSFQNILKNIKITWPVCSSIKCSKNDLAKLKVLSRLYFHCWQEELIWWSFEGDLSIFNKPSQVEGHTKVIFLWLTKEVKLKVKSRWYSFADKKESSWRSHQGYISTKVLFICWQKGAQLKVISMWHFHCWREEQ